MKCRYFDMGQCKYGSNCIYAHGDGELQHNVVFLITQGGQQNNHNGGGYQRRPPQQYQQVTITILYL